MSQFDLIAIYAAIVATGALSLEVRRWVESGPRISLSLMSDAMFAGDHSFKGQKFFALTVVNRGTLATTLTHMVVYDYESFWKFLRRRPAFTAIVPKPNFYGHDIPYVLEPGKQWHGQVRSDSDEETVERRKNGWLYIGVHASNRKRPYLIRVQKPAVL